MKYGYCRVSTRKQKVERQIENIRSAYPDAVIVTEAYTGTTTDRPEWNRLYKKLRTGDTVVFDEVSRMSRNAAGGIELYKELFGKGVNLVFLKEPHINTSVYKDKLEQQMEKINGTGNAATDKLLDAIMQALHEYTIDLAQEQIELAFQTSQKEVDFLHKRTSEGVRKAQLDGKQVGRKAGAVITTKKSVEAKELIRKYHKDFDGTLNDIDTMNVIRGKLGKLARNTYYRYKKEIQVIIDFQNT